MNEQDLPLVSVIIPVYNGDRYLGEAIESILAQSYQNSEIILIDDGSTDNTADIAQSFASVRYVYQTHGGCGAAMNRGIDLANGDFLAFLDADDLWTTEKLERQMALFVAQPDLDAVFSHVQQFYSPDIPVENRIAAHYAQEVMAGYYSSTLLIRREALHRVGHFQTEWRLGPFIDWFARAQDQHLIMLLMPEVLAKRRIHDANSGILHKDNKAANLTRVLRASLQRRRQ